MEPPNTRLLQEQVHIEYLLKQLRWDKNVTNDFLTTLDSAQLRSGFVRPLLEDTSPPDPHLEAGFIADLRSRLHGVDERL